jgi:hypothetical protein
MDFDETRLYYSHQQLQRQDGEGDAAGDNEPTQQDNVELNAVQRHFAQFLRTSN